MHEKEVELGHPRVGLITSRPFKQQQANTKHIADTNNRRKTSGVIVDVGSSEQRELILAD